MRSRSEIAAATHESLGVFGPRPALFRHLFRRQKVREPFALLGRGFARARALLAAAARPALLLALHERLVVDGAEHHERPEPLPERERVEKEEAREEDGDELARRHDGGEEERSVLADREEDEELAHGGGEGEREDVRHGGGVARDEGEGGGQGGVAEEPKGGDGGAAHRHPQHLVVRLHLVPLEELVLEGAREAVKPEVAAHEQHPVHRGVVPRAVVLARLGRDVAEEQKGGAPKRHHHRNHVVRQAVLLLRDEPAPDHHGDHLGALPERLHRKAHVLERLVLARRRHHVRERHRRVFVDGGHRSNRRALQPEHHRRHHHRHQAVVQHQKHAVREVLLLLAVRLRHDPLLRRR
mmetsp:Transcript_28790/g.94088  ORF Transcript_28790/g.94088 Transcript_28790/m.94088 type:complete len:354 (-) Transcript_28790:67-1128(-)